MYKMVLKILKETWGKCGIKTMKHSNKKEDVIELWNKMSDIKTKIKHSNVYDITLRRIRNYCGKKKKDITEEEYKAFLMLKQVFLLLKNLHVI